MWLAYLHEIVIIREFVRHEVHTTLGSLLHLLPHSFNRGSSSLLDNNQLAYKMDLDELNASMNITHNIHPEMPNIDMMHTLVQAASRVYRKVGIFMIISCLHLLLLSGHSSHVVLYIFADICFLIDLSRLNSKLNMMPFKIIRQGNAVKMHLDRMREFDTLFVLSIMVVIINVGLASIGPKLSTVAFELLMVYAKHVYYG